MCYLGAHAKICNPMISLSGIYSKLAHFPVKIGLIGGLGGVPEIFFSLESSYLCYLGAYAKTFTPMISLSGKLAHFPVKKGLIGGVGGSPKFDFHWNPPIFVT